MIGREIYVLIRLYGNVTKVENMIMHLHDEGKISEKLMCAYIQELDNYY